jgi:hypothetical protein
MFSALLLPLLLAGTPIAGTRVQANADPAVQLWISNDRRFLSGDRAKVHVRAEDDGYLIVLHSDPDGHLRVLFPLDPDDDNFVRGGKKYEVEGRGGREAFTVDGNSGRGTVYAAVSQAPFRFDGYVLGDHWDYRTLAPDRLPPEPETELTEIVRRMAGGGFDYDILTYDVVERVVYAGSSYYDSRPYYGSYYGSFYDDPWCGGYYSRCGSGLSIGLFFGTPYRRHYRPYYYGYYPAYDPFFYDPYYYRPVHYYPYNRYYGYHRPYYPRYGNHYSWPRYRDHARPYTPYRFRGSQGLTAGFRDRDYGFRRSVNTVYTPPVTRARQSENAGLTRRVVEDRGRVTRPVVTNERRETTRTEATRTQPTRNEATRREAARREGTAARETKPEARRNGATERPAPAVERRQIEARRAREPEARDRRESSVQELRGRPAEGPSIDRTPIRAQRSEPEARSARPARAAESRPEPARAAPRPEPRSEPRSVDRGDRGERGGARVERSSPPPSRSSDAGRSSPGGRGDGGGRRR